MNTKMSIKWKTVFTATLMVAILTLSSFAMLETVNAAPTLLDPLTIPKFVNQLTGPPPVYVPKIIKDPLGKGIAFEYTVTMDEKMQQILPTVDALGNPTGFGMTPVWGYGGQAKDAVTGKKLGFVLNSPGPSFEAIRGIPSVVKWVNNINTPYMFAVDPTLHWANPNNIPMDTVMDEAMTGLAPPFPPGYNGVPYPVDGIVQNPNGFNAQSPAPLVAHLHGGEVSSRFDGNPDAWWTYDGKRGTAYNTLYPTTSNAAVFYYPNEQPATTLWYHDHGLGVTRLNVMSGLAGFYPLRDPRDLLGYILPSGAYEMPLAIQDRIFQSDGSLYFPADQATNPDMHPYWAPEFFGDTIMVNGLVWPNMDVSKTSYRLRLLDGSNARFYTLSFVANPDPETLIGTDLNFTQIGTDGGYMKSAVKLTTLTIAPGERADVIVDFSGLPLGTKILMKNTANAPFPNGSLEANANKETTGQIMQFTVTGKSVPTLVKLKQAFTKAVIAPGKTLNQNLKGTWPTLPTPTKTRILTLWEVMGMGGPLEVLVNGQKYDANVSETPKEGTTEEWVIVNLTGDTHPIHTHLTQFQLVSRQPIDADAYAAAWTVLNRGEPPYTFTPTELPIGPYLTLGPATGPAPNEFAWKDTIQMNPGEVTTIRLRFSPIDGSAKYSFDPTIGPGYVWHCHIIDHEDNEMMRPYIVVK